MKIVAAQACLLALVGCAAAPSQVRVDQGDVDLAKCQSFGWLPASKDAASLTEQRVRAAAIAQLQAKGYAIANDKPDCRMTYVFAAHERAKQKPSVGVGAGGGSGGVGGGIGVSLPIGRRGGYVGEFTIDVVDVAANAQIWSGSLDADFEAAELSEEEAKAVVAAVLDEFPDRTAAL